MTASGPILKGNSIYVLESKKDYSNQWFLLNQKIKLLKKKLNFKGHIYGYMLSISKVNAKHTITLEEFKDIKIGEEEVNEELINNIHDFILQNHLELSLKDYIKIKYSLDIANLDQNRNHGSINIISSFSKMKVSFLTSLILFTFVLNSLVVYYKITKTTYSLAGIAQFIISIAIELFYLIILNYTCAILEKNFSKKVKYPILFIFLVGMLYVFVKNLAYL